MRTPWGYDAEELGPIVSLERFHKITNYAYTNNPRLESALYAASQAIRNYCGWHVCPSVECTAYPEGGTIVVGAYKTCASVVQNGGVSVEAVNTNEDDFVKNLMTIRAEERLALAVRRPAGFKKLTKAS